MSVRTANLPSGSDDQAHRRAGDRRLDRHAGVHQGERRAAGGRHRGRAVGRHALRHEPDHVREVLGVGRTGQEGALGQVAVADLAPAGAAHRLVLAGAVGRHVVVVDVALLGLGADRVDPLDVRGRPERRDGQRLGLAAGEQARAVRPREEADFDGDRAGSRRGRGRPCGCPRRGRARARSSCGAGRTGSCRREPRGVAASSSLSAAAVAIRPLGADASAMPVLSVSIRPGRSSASRGRASRWPRRRAGRGGLA